MFFRFSVTEGKFLSSKSFKEILESLKDGNYTLEILKVRNKRSLNQNDFYWGPFLDVLCDCMGETIPEMDEKSRQRAKEEVHDYLKSRFGKGKTVKNPLDKRLRIKLPQSTANMDTKEFEEYLESIRVYFGKWGWKLPYPDDGDPGPSSII